MRSIICFPHTSSPGISRKSNRKMHFGELGLLFSRLFPMRFSEKATAKCILVAFWQETRMYLRKKATLIGVFGKCGCLFTETQVVSPKKGNRKSGYRGKGLLFHQNTLTRTWFPAGRRAGVPLWPVVCPMPAGGSAVKGRQRDGRLPVAERASPLTALQAAGTHARRAKHALKELGKYKFEGQNKRKALRPESQCFC